MQFWTSDRYVATVHRVRIPEEELKRRNRRQSVAFFVNADDGVIIKPLDGSGKHEPVEALAYLKSRIFATYRYWIHILRIDDFTYSALYILMDLS